MHALLLVPLLAFSPARQTPPATQSIVAPGASLVKLGDGYAFTEGPVADKAGNVYFTDQPNDRIMLWTVDNKVSEWLKPAGRSNGMWFDHKGNLISCADNLNELWSISPRKKISVLVKDFEGKLLNGPNDVWVRPDGGMYITDPLYRRPYWKRDPKTQQPGQFVFFLSPDRKTLTPVATDLNTPNGIIGTPDGKTLYVADLGANETFRYHIQPDGSLTDKTAFCPMGSDGMTMDAKGDIYCSNRGVTAFDPTGQRIFHVDVPEDWVGHVCFGGSDHKLLFITASHGIYGLQMSVRGAY
jgi:gluconolactonase